MYVFYVFCVFVLLKKRKSDGVIHEELMMMILHGFSLIIEAKEETKVIPGVSYSDD